MFDTCLYFNTASLARQLEREWTVAFKHFGLTPPQAFMLRAVLAKPGMLQRELAESMVISRPTATRALDGLQAKGLIERRASGNDGREWEIHATPTAVGLHEPLNEASAAVTTRLKRILGAGAFADTVTMVKKTRAALA